MITEALHITSVEQKRQLKKCTYKNNTSIMFDRKHEVSPIYLSFQN